MKKYRELMSREQQVLFPQSLNEYVSGEDLVRYVNEVIDELDISEIESQYSNFGRPGYSPRVLVKLLVYGKLRGIRSSRELASAASENVRFMYLLQNERPNFRTIALFRKRYHKELSELLKQTVIIGLNQGVVTLKHVAIDGSKFRSYASKSSFKTRQRLEQELLELLESSVAEDIEVDEKEDEEWNDSDGEGGIPASLGNKQQRVKQIRQALEEYKNDNPQRVSTTDSESRYMKGIHGSHPGYNVQAAVDEDSGMVVGGYATNRRNDYGELKPMLEEIEENASKNPEKVTADKAYGTVEGVVEIHKRGIDGYLPRQRQKHTGFSRSEFQYDKNSDCYVCPNDRTLVLISNQRKQRRKVYRCSDCTGCELRENCLASGERRTLKISYYTEILNEMAAKMSTDDGIAMMRARAPTVEKLFGVLRSNRKLRQIFFRSKQMVDAMVKVEFLAHNIEKLARIRRATSLEQKACPV